MAERLRCGIIGCGVIAPAHVQCYQMQDDVEVVWACDLIEEKARALAEKFGIPNVTTDYRDVMADADVEAVSVCTDHASHAPITVAALDGGKHVLCEKALAASRRGMDEMFAAAGRRPDLVFEGVFQHRFDAVNRCLKDLVEAGAFGQLLTAGVQMRCLRTKDYYRGDSWRGTWDKEGGAVMINQAIHFLDLLLWLVGPAEALCGAHTNLTHSDVIETEDTAVAILRFASGALGTVEATCSSHLGWEPTVSIHGTLGSVDMRNDNTLKVAFTDPEMTEKVKSDLSAALHQHESSSGKSYYGGGHPAQIADFVDAIRDKRPPFIPARSARHTVDVVLGIYESETTGRWVSVNAEGTPAG